MASDIKISGAPVLQALLTYISSSKICALAMEEVT